RTKDEGIEPGGSNGQQRTGSSVRYAANQADLKRSACKTRRLSALQAVATEVLSPKGLVRHRPAPLRLAFFGAKEASVRSLGAYEALSSKAKAQAIVPAENKRIPKRSALDPRIKKALQSSARKLPIQQRHLHASHQRRSLRA